MCLLKDFPCHVVQKGEAKMDCDKDCDAFKASQEKLASKEDEIRKEKERKAQQVINSSLLRLIFPPILYFYSCAWQKKILVIRWLVSRASKSCRRLNKFYTVFSQAIRDLKIRRRRVSTTAAVSWGEWGEVAVVWREKLTLRSTVEEADGFITSFRGLSVF